MRKVEYRFWTLDQFREEEKWLNKKAEEGWALVDIFAVRYVFVPCDPGEYTYKIMFTDDMPNTETRKDFESFMAESGIEAVGKYHHWGYYRKKNDGTPFRLFNSKTEELVHVNKIKKLSAILLAIVALSFAVELMAFIHVPTVFPLVIFAGCAFVFIFKVYRGLSKMSEELEKEISLFE